MLSFNKYSSGHKSKLLLLFLMTIFMLWTVKALNVQRVLDTEIQSFQKVFPSFSSVGQLVDDGSSYTGLASFLEPNNILYLISQFPSIISGGSGSKSLMDLVSIKLFIKFEDLQTIYSDRDLALLDGINTSPKEVSCKISDGKVTLKCKVWLKGDLHDHWNAKERLSLGLKVKGGYIDGMKRFSIQKPRARSFPYDHTFQKLVSNIGNLSSHRQKVC